MKKLAIFLGLLALATAGTASAVVLARHVTLKAGQCTTVKQVRVCAAKGVTVRQPPITITQPAITVTSPAVTVTVTTTTTSTPPPSGGSKVVKDFSGNGEQTEAPFTTTVGETLSWTYENTNGDFPTGMFINDDSQLEVLVDGDGQTTSGSTYLKPGEHTFHVITVGNWTIHVG